MFRDLAIANYRGGRRFRTRQKWGGKIAQSKISQDRLILTLGYSRSGDRELRGAAFSHTSKMIAIGAQAKIGQDRLILTLMGSREPGRRGFKPRLRGVFAQAKNVSRSGDRELQKRGKIAQAKMFRDQVFIC